MNGREIKYQIAIYNYAKMEISVLRRIPTYFLVKTLVKITVSSVTTTELSRPVARNLV